MLNKNIHGEELKKEKENPSGIRDLNIHKSGYMAITVSTTANPVNRKVSARNR
jgi:hypothetical protein